MGPAGHGAGQSVGGRVEETLPHPLHPRLALRGPGPQVPNQSTVMGIRSDPELIIMDLDPTATKR